MNQFIDYELSIKRLKEQGFKLYNLDNDNERKEIPIEDENATYCSFIESKGHGGTVKHKDIYVTDTLMPVVIPILFQDFNDIYLSKTLMMMTILSFITKDSLEITIREEHCEIYNMHLDFFMFDYYIILVNELEDASDVSGTMLINKAYRNFEEAYHDYLLPFFKNKIKIYFDLDIIDVDEQLFSLIKMIKY